MLGMEWIGHLAEALGSIVPRVIHCRTTHRGVMFRFGKVRLINPGITWYIPMWSDPVIWPIARQTLNLPAQVFTSDGKSMMASTAVIYEVSDIHRALVMTYDLEETIRDVAQGAVKRVLLDKSTDQLLKEQDKTDQEITDAIKSELLQFGILVTKAFITDFSSVRVLRLIQNTPSNREIYA